MRKLQFAVFGVTVGFSLACGGMDIDTGSMYIPPPTPVGGSATCPPGAVTGSAMSAGESLTLVALHPDDAYYGGDTMSKMPLKGKSTGGGLSVTEGCWYSGEFEGNNGDSFYFYKAAFTR